MTHNPTLSEARPSRGDVTLELQAGDDPTLVVAQGDNRVRVELVHVKALIAALTNATADLAEVLAAGGVYHA